MSISAVSINSLLSRYHRALARSEPRSGSSGAAQRADRVEISSEGREAGLSDRIGEAAVRALREQSVDELIKKSR
ncbi:MAG: hypothetical protein IT350_16010 [Deltaproteobacteria bacterium]|nr:hypothetical protein [Deltaproteobacteria bacterium]